MKMMSIGIYHLPHVAFEEFEQIAFVDVAEENFLELDANILIQHLMNRQLEKSTMDKILYLRPSLSCLIQNIHWYLKKEQNIIYFFSCDELLQSSDTLEKIFQNITAVHATKKYDSLQKILAHPFMSLSQLNNMKDEADEVQATTNKDEVDPSLIEMTNHLKHPITFKSKIFDNTDEDIFLNRPSIRSFSKKLSQCCHLFWCRQNNGGEEKEGLLTASFKRYT